MEGELANLAHEIGIDPGFRPVGTTAKVISRRPEWGEPSRAPILDDKASLFDQTADFEPMLQARFELTFEAMLSGETFVSGEALADRLTRIAKAAGIS
ncbi:MAG: hypothetical protein ING19_01430 [Azospirillum sp.]|nr:hypothetical protein [Azospirillum sp.]